jgi:hypothetical protein
MSAPYAGDVSLSGGTAESLPDTIEQRRKETGRDASGRAHGSSPFIGYVLSRTTGLPGAMGDIGNWTEPLGLASLYVEACVFALGVYGLARLRRTQ